MGEGREKRKHCKFRSRSVRGVGCGRRGKGLDHLHIVHWEETLLVLQTALVPVLVHLSDQLNDLAL